MGESREGGEARRRANRGIGPLEDVALALEDPRPALNARDLRKLGSNELRATIAELGSDIELAEEAECPCSPPRRDRLRLSVRDLIDKRVRSGDDGEYLIGQVEHVDPLAQCGRQRGVL